MDRKRCKKAMIVLFGTGILVYLLFGCSPRMNCEDRTLEIFKQYPNAYIMLGNTKAGPHAQVIIPLCLVKGKVETRLDYRMWNIIILNPEEFLMHRKVTEVK